MEYEVKAYLNSGFDLNNIPSTPDVLEQCDSIELPNIDVNQDFDLNVLRAKISYDTAIGIDYILIGNTYYIVNSVKRLNGNVTELGLVVDYWNTNLKNNDNDFKILSGFTKRANPLSDILGQYTEPEPFTPSRELELQIAEVGDTIKQTSLLNLVLSTIDLDQITSTLKSFTAKGEQISSEFTAFSTGIEVKGVKPSSVGITGIGQAIDSNGGAYYTYETVKDKVAILKSFGLENAIITMWQLPSAYIQQLPYTGPLSINGVSQTINATLPYKYSKLNAYTQNQYTACNNKCYIGEYNSYSLLSNCSGGGVQDIKPEDILYDQETAPILFIYADPRPEGKPTCCFKYFKKIDVAYKGVNAVNGLQWATIPFVYTQRENDVLEDIKSNYKMFNAGIKAAGSSAQAVASAFTFNAGGAIKGVEQGALALNEFQETNQINQYNKTYVVPEVRFPRSSSIRDFLGNGFYITKLTLSGEDLYNYDLFLTKYGYSMTQLTQKEHLFSRQQFNYIQTQDIQLDYNNCSIRYRIGAENQLNRGVRLWHIKPVRILDPYQNPLAIGGSQ